MAAGCFAPQRRLPLLEFETGNAISLLNASNAHLCDTKPVEPRGQFIRPSPTGLAAG
jgi:hypothetical protein